MNPLPVVVSFRGIASALGKPEALQAVNEAAQQDGSATPMERAKAMAAMGKVLNDLKEAERDAGSREPVLTTVDDARATRLQSLIASGEKASTVLEPLVSGGLEAKFDTSDWGGWATVAWEKLKHLKPHDLVRPKRAVAEALPESGRIALLGDWGTGLYGARPIAETILGDPQPYAMLLHLGDVYYSGNSHEVTERFLQLWPFRPEAVNRALNSNHEMYSGGEAYFRQTLPRFGQEASYFAYQNKHWTLVGLDVAYEDHDIDEVQVAWLQQILAQAGERKVVFFSHHQLYSHFEKQGTRLTGDKRLGPILRSKRVFAWYWGHEHRCAIFEGRDSLFGLYGRCIGHSGMPESRKATQGLPRATDADYARAEWRRSRSVAREGNQLPDVVVLDGRNEYIPGEEEKFSPHGYAVLTLDGPVLKEQVMNPLGQVIYEKTLAS